VILALRNLFDSVLVPGQSRSALRLSRRLLVVILPVRKRVGAVAPFPIKARLSAGAMKQRNYYLPIAAGVAR
jgi:hypothetical protein